MVNYSILSTATFYSRLGELTTSGNTVKLLPLRFKYLRPERRVKAIGNVVSRL